MNPVNYEIYVAQAYNKLPALTLNNYLLYIIRESHSTRWIT